MKTFPSSRLGAYLSVLIGVLAIILPAEAQQGQVIVRGRKASDSGLLARVRDGVNPGKFQAAKGGLGQAAMMTKAEFRTKGLMLVGKNAQGAAAAMTSAELELKAKQLMATGLYEYVEPDWIVTVSQVPTDTAYTSGSLWGLRNTGQSGGAVGVDVNAHAAWAVTTGSPTVIVGVVDTGIRYTHQDLVGNIWVNSGEIAANGIDDDANGYIDDIHGINGITNSGNPMDDNNHGTHCAGTIGATANNAGQIVGVAWNVKLMGLKFLSASGSGNTSDAIKCIDYGVAKGAHILSNSWGGGGYSQALRDSIAAASSAGVLFVAAAGNSSSNNDVTQNYPSNYDPVNVVAVAAVDRTGALASFSSYGATTVDVGAPGVAILSSTAASDSSYDTYNGTSMATPHVAGVAALIKSQFPTATMLEIKNRLMATTRPLASLAGRTVSGGIVDAHAALTVAADGVLELRASAATSPLRNGVNTAFYVTVSDLTPVTGATVTGALGAGTPVAFLDNGIAPDVNANDGTYSANLTVPTTGSSTTLNVTASNGAAPATAAFPFSIISPPGNDDFVNRVLLAAGTTQATGSNQLSTFEVGEPQYPSVAGTKSVWWEWAAGTTGSITVTTSGSDYDTTLAIYSGSGTLASLVHLGSNDDFSGLASSVTFSATSGQRYYVQVNGYSGDEGSITLNYPSPANVNSPPVIVTQPAGTILVAGDPLALSVTASGTAPLTYQWRLNGSNIGGATSASYSVASVAEVDEGNYTVTITNAFGNLTSATAFVGVDPISVRPSNDLFVNAETLAGAAGRVNGTNLRASAETGEPNHAAASTPVESVWYRWTAPAAGTLSLDTYGSSLDTTLAAYTGAAVNALTQRAANNDAGGVQSFISVAVTAGEVLQIAVDGAGTAESIFSLNYFFQPTVPGLANDAFASRTVVSGAGGAFSGSNIGATGEVGEPVHEASAPPTHSVWWSWTAPANGVAVIDTLGSDFDTVVAVYTGTDVTALTLVTSNDDAGGPQSRVGFSCTAGTAYVIAVDGRGAAQGLVSLNITSGATEPEIVVEQPVGTGLVDGGAGVSWGSVATTENATRTFTVSNTGGARLTGLTVQIEGTNAADFVLTTPPAAAVNGGASTTFSVRFTPAGLGAHTALLRLASNDGDENPFDIPLSGNGVLPAPEIVLEEPVGTGLVDGSATAAFGPVVVGSSASKTFTVRNTGNATLSGLAVTFSGANAADFSVTTPPAATVAPGGNTTFTVRFTPVGFGARTAAMLLASNDADENPFDVALTGSGIATPPLVRTIDATDRGWYDAAGRHDSFNLNYATGLFADSGSIEFRSFFVFNIPTLGANETVTSVSLRLWNPSNGFVGADATETLELRDVTTPISTLTGGTGGTATFADLANGTIYGGPHTVSASDNDTFITIPLNNSLIAAMVSRSGSSLAVGGSLSSIVGLGAQTVFGFTFADNMADTQLVFTTVTSYTDAEIAVEQPVGTGLTDGASTVNFGGLAPGTTADRVFTIRNVGIYDLTGLGITVTGANAADFSVTANPSAPLVPAGATTFTVRFAPTAGGTKNATLSIASNDPDENPFDIALTGIGVVPTPEIVVEQPVGTSLVDGTATIDFGYRGIGANGNLVFTVRNSGTANLTGLGITIDGANAAEFSVTTAPTGPVIPGGNTTFTVQFAPTAAGVQTAALHLASNDGDENPFDIALSGRGYTAPVGLDFQILSLGTTGSAVVDHGAITGDDRGGIAVTADRVFVTGDSATSRHALNLTGGASIGRVSNGLCSDIGSGAAYVLAHSGVETTGSGTVSQLIQLDPLTGALTGTVIPLSTSFTLAYGSGVFSGNGRVVVHNRTRVYDILVPSGVVTDMGPMSVPAWYSSETWASWGVAEYFNGELHLAYRANSGSTIVRSRVPDGLVQTIATFSNLSDLASWTVSPITGRWYFHHENGSQFGGSSETLGYADATFAMGPPTQPPAITSPLAAMAFTGGAISYQITASRSPTSYNAAGLPSGMSVNTATGIISGSVAVVGVYPVTISATNIIGTTSATLTLSVVDTLTSFFDDFDPGIDTLLWSGFGGTVTANTAGQAAGAGSTGNSLHFDGDASRFATTIAMDTRGINAMSFLIALADGSAIDWENADSGEEVVLEYSTDGVTFTQVGGPYSNRVWQNTVVALPIAAKTASTRFRWRQLSHSGAGFDHWAIEDVRINSSVTTLPEIAVEQPVGTSLVDGTAVANFGTRSIGTNGSLTFTVRNTGTADLGGFGITIDGANAAEFSVTSSPTAPVVPGGSTTFTVRFAPTVLGARTAALHLVSNDGDENPFDIVLNGSGYTAPVGLDFQILSLGTTGAAVVDHNAITGDDRGGIAVTADRVFVTGDSATSRHALDLTGGASIGRVSNGLCSDIGSGTAYVLAHNGVETSGSGTVSQLIQLDPLTGALTGTVIPLSTSFTLPGYGGVFSGNGRVVVHNGTRVYDILVPSGVVTDMGPMSVPAWYSSESWATWGVAEYFNGELHLAYRADSGETIVRSRVPDGLVETIATFTDLGDLASWTVSPVTGRWYFHHEGSSQFGGSSETLGYADATFAMGPPTQPPAITSPLAATAYVGQPFSYQIRASRSPQSYNATSLPAWLSVNTSTGLLSGAPPATGVHVVNISATNAIGTTTETLTITVGTAFATVAIFANGSYVDASATGELEYTRQALLSLGCVVTPFTGVTAADWNAAFTAANLVVVPELENSSLTLAPDALNAINTHLANGRGLIVMGDGGTNDTALLNSLRGWTLATGADLTSGTVAKVAGVPGFVNSPATLAALNATYTVTTASLPAGTQPVYQNSTYTAVFRNGRVGFMAYDWFAGPDSAWSTVLGDLIVAVTQSSTQPEIGVEQPVGTHLTDSVSTASFGNVGIGTNASLTFTVRNSGGVNLTGLVPTIDGANAADFTVTTAPASVVAPGAATTFVVRFAPGALGSRSAALHIASNDADENPFDISLAGTSFIPAPEIAVEQPVGTNLTDGVSTVNLGAVLPGSFTNQTFTIRNSGTADLSGLAVSIDGGNAADFTVATPPLAILAPGATTTFVVRFTPGALGARTAALHIASNDVDETPFDIFLSGLSSNVFPIGNYDPLPQNSSHWSDYLLGSRIQVTSQSTLASFGVDVRATGPQAKFGLYQDVEGSPGTLVAQTGNFTLDRLGRIETPPLASVILSPGYYWIMAVYNVDASVGVDSSTTNQIAYRAHSFTNSLPSTFGTPIFYEGQNFNYYILLTATSATPPSVTTIAPTNITSNSATLRAEVNPNGHATTVEFFIDGVSQGTVSAGSGNTADIVTLDVTGLAAGTNHSVVANAFSVGGSAVGNPIQFTTLGDLPIEYYTVAARNGLVPDAGENPRIPAGAHWTSLGSPAINELGEVAFTARWSPSLNGSTGIAATIHSNFGIVVMQGDSPQETVGVTWKSFKAPVIGPDGSIVFLGTIAGTGVTTANDQVIGALIDGTTRIVAREGDILPGTGGAMIKAFTSATILLGGEVYYTASLQLGTGIPAVTSTSDLVACRWDVLDNYLLFREGQTHPDFNPGETLKAFSFLKSTIGSLGQGRSFVGDGLLAHWTLSSGRQILVERNNALISFVTGGPTTAGPLAKFNSPCGGGEKFALLGSLQLGVDGVTSANAKGIFFGDNADLAPIARLRDPAPGYPDINSVFSALGDPVVGGYPGYSNDLVAFLGKVTGPTTTTRDDQGIWLRSSDGILSLIAREGTRPPGALEDVYWKTFTSLAMPALSGPLFTATLGSTTGTINLANDMALYGYDYSGNLRQLLREGQTIGDKTVRTFVVLKAVVGSAGVTRQHHGAGAILNVTYTDGTFSILRVTPALE